MAPASSAAERAACVCSWVSVSERRASASLGVGRGMSFEADDLDVARGTTLYSDQPRSTGHAVCDNVRAYDGYQGAPDKQREPTSGSLRPGGGTPTRSIGPDCPRRARARPARRLGPITARLGRAQWRERADALAGGAGGHQPDADGRGAYRGRSGPASLSAAAPGRERRGDGGTRGRAPARRQYAEGPPLRG